MNHSDLTDASLDDVDIETAQELQKTIENVLAKQPKILFITVSEDRPIQAIEQALSQLKSPSLRHWEPYFGQKKFGSSKKEQQTSFYSSYLKRQSYSQARKNSEYPANCDFGDMLLDYLSALTKERTTCAHRAVWIPLLECILCMENQQKISLLLHGFLQEESEMPLSLVSPVRDSKVFNKLLSATKTTAI